MADQPLLAGLAGTHLEPSGAAAAGPPVEVCDACRCDVSWNPGLLCRTPEAHHRWKEEEIVDQNQKEKLAAQVQTVIALAGDGSLEAPLVQETALRLLGTEAFAEWPEKKGAQVEFIDRLATAVMAELGSATPEQQGTAGVQTEGWAEDGGGPEIIKTPIGG